MRACRHARATRRRMPTLDQLRCGAVDGVVPKWSTWWGDGVMDAPKLRSYSGGDFMSRAGSGIGVGSISLHPRGFVHGPQPGERGTGGRPGPHRGGGGHGGHPPPLRLGPGALAVDDEDYPWSWAAKGG